MFGKISIISSSIGKSFSITITGGHNVESTVMMVKTKFGDSVRSKTEVAAKNEVLSKMLCHNICCLISAMYELGIEANLCTTKALPAQQNV